MDTARCWEAVQSALHWYRAACEVATRHNKSKSYKSYYKQDWERLQSKLGKSEGAQQLPCNRHSYFTDFGGFRAFSYFTHLICDSHLRFWWITMAAYLWRILVLGTVFIYQDLDTHNVCTFFFLWCSDFMQLFQIVDQQHTTYRYMSVFGRQGICLYVQRRI